MKEMLAALRRALGAKQHAYRTTFNGPLAQIVLKDLARFCRAHESTFEGDPRGHAQLEGRREVWLRIQEQLRLTPEQLWALYQERTQEEE